MVAMDVQNPIGDLYAEARVALMFPLRRALGARRLAVPARTEAGADYDAVLAQKLAHASPGDPQPLISHSSRGDPFPRPSSAHRSPLSQLVGIAMNLTSLPFFSHR